MTTVLLHGFWGQPKDWNAVLERLPLGATVLVPDLFEEGPLAPTTSFKDWPQRFWHWLEHECGGEPVCLVGYSMGARLAISAAIQNPKRISRALFISGRPQLKPNEVAQREQWERQTAEKFLHLPWPELERDWQAQAVFAGTQAVPRRQSPLLREMLALSLSNWSPRHHGITEEQLRALLPTMEWAFGALDQNYQGVAKDLRELPVQGQISLLPNIGHRVIAEAADFVSGWIVKG